MGLSDTESDSPHAANDSVESARRLSPSVEPVGYDRKRGTPLVGAAQVTTDGAGSRPTAVGVGGSTGPKVNVTLPPRFDESVHVWANWSAQVKRIFGVMDLSRALDPLEHANVTLADRSAAVTILHEIMPQVDSDLYTQSAVATACDIWSGLERKYKSKDLFRLNQLTREFHSTRQGDNETPAAWVVRMGTLKCQLLALGGEAPDRSHKIALIDRSLPGLVPGQSSSDHNTFFAELRVNMDTMSVGAIEDRLISRAQAFTEQLAVTGSASGVMAFHHAGKRHAGNSRNSGSGSRNRQKQANDQPAVICTTCTTRGHKNFQCPGKDDPLAKEIRRAQIALKAKLAAAATSEGVNTLEFDLDDA